MKLTILGSGTNLHPKRAAAGYLLDTDTLLVMDFGPRTLVNLLKTGVDRHTISHILFSHFHADHFSDFITFFFDAVMYSKFVGTRPDLTLIGPRGAKRLFGTILSTFPSFNAGDFRVRIREVGDRAFHIGKTRVQPRTVEHSEQLHCLGYRIEYGGQAVAYSGDAQYCRALIELCDGVGASVLDCSFPANKPGTGHMHAGDCGRVAHEAASRRLILSHFYPIAERYDVTKQAGRYFEGRIEMGRDLQTVRL